MSAESTMVKDATRPVIDLEAPGTEGLAGRILAEVRVVVTLVGDVPGHVRRRWSSNQQPQKACHALLFRRELGHRIVLRRSDEHMLLADTEILRHVATRDMKNPLRNAVLDAGWTWPGVLFKL
ncbi:hypothetical protein ACFVU4_19060 [Streptomyces sp. NPDC058107]|uniref:hypothetical protein n=1 Tax=Streptomyces sp. NPDC058107 TaxID=3346343 RepID=UPI0036EF3C7C